MLKSLGQIRQEVAQLAGIQNSLGIYDFDTTTFPTIDQANIFINDSIRETTSSYDYTFLETSRSYPWNHSISGVQSVSLSGLSVAPLIGSGITGSITPFPAEVLNYSWSANNQPNLVANNYSGISFSGTDILGNAYVGVSTSGSVSYQNWSGVGYTYELNPDVDKIIALMLSNSVSGQTPKGIKMNEISWNDMERLIPIGNINAQGTPIYYSEMPGLSPNNNKQLQFFPFPQPIFSGESFIIHQKKRHVDMTTDTQTQNMIPESYQVLITQATLEKIFDLLDSPKAQLSTQRKETLIAQMRLWDAQQPNKMPQWTDFSYNSVSGRAYDNSTVVYLPYN